MAPGYPLNVSLCIRLHSTAATAGYETGHLNPDFADRACDAWRTDRADGGGD
jgi:hypothetical protein